MLVRYMRVFRLLREILSIALAAGLSSCTATNSSPSAKLDPEQIIGSVEPSSGQGSEATFAVRYSTSAGRVLREVRVLFNSDLDGRNACYVYYGRTENTFSLVDDAGLGSARLAAGASGSLENSQCRLDGEHSSAQVTGNALTISLTLRFKSSFHGDKNIYLYAETADGWNSGLQSRGRWTVIAAR